MTKLCLWCKKDIHSLHRKRKYCSLQCCRSYNRRRLKIDEYRPYVKFFISYCKKHAYYNYRALYFAYIKENGMYHHKFPHEKKNGNIEKYFKAIMMILGSEGFLDCHSASKHRRNVYYYSTEELIEGLEKVLKLEKLHSFEKARPIKSMFFNQDWRHFEELEKFDLYKGEKMECAKMHFLGTVDEVDPHFRELWGVNDA